MITFPKYELKNGEVLKDGHTMFLEDVVKNLNVGSKMAEAVKALERKIEHGCTNHTCKICDS